MLSDRIRARNTQPLPAVAAQRGVALLEALIAILIFSMGILAVLGLQAASIKNSVQAKYRTDASFLASQIIGQMWVDRSNLASYAGSSYGPKTTWINQISSTLPTGNGTIAVNVNTVTVTVTWKAAGETTTHNFVTTTQINNS